MGYVFVFVLVHTVHIKTQSTEGQRELSVIEATSITWAEVIRPKVSRTADEL